MNSISIKTIVLIILVIFIVSNLSLAQNVSFSADSVIYDGKYPKAIITQDFNNDNSPDIAELVWDNTNGNHIAIFFNDGNGVFNVNPDSIYSVGDFPVDLKTDDFNNDGYADLATSLLNDSSIVFWYGNGDGSFGNKDSIDVPIKCKFLGLSDFNNDNNLDLAVVENYKLVSILGNGDGTFQSPTIFSSAANPWDLEVYDLNSDGYTDILVSNGSGSYFYIHYNDSLGGFSNRVAISTIKPPWFIDVCDFNSDTYPDIAVGSGSYEYDNIFVLVGDSLGNFVTSDTSSPCGYIDNICTSDLNNDGKTDILAVDNYGMYGILGDGYGNFINNDTIVYDPGNFNGFVTLAEDLNGDNKTDLIIGRVNQISIYYNTGMVNSVESKAITAKSFELYQNYPNPFNPNTIINYQLKENSEVELNVYNLLGQKIATLVSESQTAGNYKVQWNAVNLPSSIYFYRLKSADGIQIKKMQLIK